MMPVITDIKDSEIQEVQRLRRRDYRKKTGLTIVEGYPEVSRAVKAGVCVRTLYICPELFTAKAGEFDHLEIVEVRKETFAQMAFGKRLKGILAVCQPPVYQLPDIRLKEDPLVIVLESVEKPGNLGAVIRSADGAGADAVMMCDGKTDINNHNVVRSSIGTVFTVTTVAETKEEILAFLRRNNFQIFAATAQADLLYTDVDFKGASAIIVGNEHEGLSSFWLDTADHKIKIPMQGASGCLNVAMSASIFLYEAHRQKHGKAVHA